jgi:hypothetical protein
MNDIEYLNKLVFQRKEKSLIIRNATNQWWIEWFAWDSVILDFPESPTKRWRVKSQKSWTLTTGWNMWVITEDLRIRKLTPTEYEKLQTVPENYTDCVTPNQRIKMCWNWWNVDTIAHILEHINF